MSYLKGIINHDEGVSRANKNANQTMWLKRFQNHQPKAFCHKQTTSVHNYINQLILTALVIVIGGVVKSFF